MPVLHAPAYDAEILAAAHWAAMRALSEPRVGYAP